jgi:hypothetical protein
MVLWMNAFRHQPDGTLIRLPSLRGTHLPSGRPHEADGMARKETQFSFAAQKDSLVHQLF